ncbi:hypothetical protein L6452_13168 [Arctium lappa]|uniref:Uncharacterized protein n=1 Tax=Arctium lappa TaxID=4217 RepID=A0ACB9CHR1_ARCLA|nr:hypothetical protein L6452_13168 [Arctium lappa]
MMNGFQCASVTSSSVGMLPSNMVSYGVLVLAVEDVLLNVNLLCEFHFPHILSALRPDLLNRCLIIKVFWFFFFFLYLDKQFTGPSSILPSSIIGNVAGLVHGLDPIDFYGGGLTLHGNDVVLDPTFILEVEVSTPETVLLLVTGLKFFIFRGSAKRFSLP